MPIYEYQCEECEHTFDMLRKITDEPLKECPECGGPVNKLVSSTSFILKGGGWYATEYGKNRTFQGENKKSAVKPVTTESNSNAATTAADKSAAAA
ncbi:MAG: zinc ribbon domain-containing protein [Deltaproteobacteria bacterium]|nr:zinc ribbon domain-containing protein [Deltaproteobacteria bacterium]